MRRKKSKLDKIRHEKAQSELAEATFKPHINPRRPATAAAQLQRAAADGEGGDARGVGHLMQYVRWGSGGESAAVILRPLPLLSRSLRCRSTTSTSARSSAGSSSSRSKTGS